VGRQGAFFKCTYFGPSILPLKSTLRVHLKRVNTVLWIESVLGLHCCHVLMKASYFNLNIIEEFQYPMNNV